MPGAGLSCCRFRKAPLGKPAFQPYWGKPAVRNDREDRGNVGIIRSPLRASILPDWIPALSPEELTQAVHDNLRNLGLDVLDVVNFRSMHGVDAGSQGPAEGSIEAPLTVLAELQHKGLVRRIGLSNVTPAQIAEGRRICEIVCVQNEYNLAHRANDALIDDLARDGIPYVPYFPLGGFNPLQSSILSKVAARLDATPMQVALAWLLRRAPNVLLIPGTSSVTHLRENLASAELNLPDDAMTSLNEIGDSVP
jgi:pyridoxine 4-dehydrogenase